MQFSARNEFLKPSPTLALAAKAKELQAAGFDVVNLTVGEPDWPTLKSAKQAGIMAIENNFTKYTPAPGVIELRTAIAEKVSQQWNVPFKAQEVAVTAGAKYAIFAALQVSLNSHDEVLIPAPYWVSYPTMVELSSGTPVIMPTSEQSRFKITAEQLKKSITEKTKIFLFCSPSNPTGIMYSKDELLQIGKVFREHPNVAIISDDIYDQLAFNEEAPHLLALNPDLRDRFLSINGASKALSMTGWRMGWAIGPKKWIELIADYCSQSTGSSCAISQKAALAGLQSGAEEQAENLKALVEKYKYCREEIGKLKFIRLIEPDGAFYLWVDVTKCLTKSFRSKKLDSSKQISECLINDLFLATVPGEEFGAPGYIRLSFAATRSSLEKAIHRLGQFELELI